MQWTARELDFNLPGELVYVFRSLSLLEGMASKLEPDWNLLEHGIEPMKEALAPQYMKSRLKENRRSSASGFQRSRKRYFPIAISIITNSRDSNLVYSCSKEKSSTQKEKSSTQKGTIRHTAPPPTNPKITAVQTSIASECARVVISSLWTFEVDASPTARANVAGFKAPICATAAQRWHSPVSGLKRSD
jgi:predicted unusual protein kinase regulating ubiquinone biosynthesis (AarF/ABC1/UbiB family)